MRTNRVTITTMGVWLLSSFAFSSGQLAPELSMLDQAHKSPEYPLLKEIQELTIDLQLLELTIKNRRDPKIESKISKALTQIDEQSKVIGAGFKENREKQLQTLFGLIDRARKYGSAVGVEEFQWNDLVRAIKDEQISAGTIAVHAKTGIPNQTVLLNIVTLSPIRIGKQTVWQFILPPRDKFSYWVAANRVAVSTGNAFPTKYIQQNALKKYVESSNTLYSEAKVVAEGFYRDSHKKLYNAFEGQHYGILNRMNMARKKLTQLGKANSSMGVPEEFAALYNQLLDNLFSYGMDISFSDSKHRDFTIKGFLFGPTPEASEELLTRLKYTAPANTYNSPSS